MAQETFDELLRRRLGVIEEQGVNATSALRQRTANRQAEQQAKQQLGYQQQLNNAQASQTTYSTKGGPKSFQDFMNSIRQQESGGNYGAVNKDSGALGAYQIMPSNLNSWAKAAGVGHVTRSQFLGSPDIQNRIAEYQLQQYYNAYGPAGAAVAWYAGPGAAKKFVRSGSASNRSQGKYPTVSNYIQQVLMKMGIY